MKLVPPRQASHVIIIHYINVPNTQKKKKNKPKPPFVFTSNLQVDKKKRKKDVRQILIESYIFFSYFFLFYNYYCYRVYEPIFVMRTPRVAAALPHVAAGPVSGVYKKYKRARPDRKTFQQHTVEEHCASLPIHTHKYSYGEKKIIIISLFSE